MDTGTSVALFLVLSFVILILFCLISKYFQYRMNKKIQQQGEDFSQVDQITIGEDVGGQYQQFLLKTKQNQIQKNLTQQERDKAFLFQKTEAQDPFNGSEELLHGVSILKRRLQGEKVQNLQPTGRSVKSFKHQKFQQSGRSSNGSDRGLMTLQPIKKNPNQPITKHEFISCLVCYNEQGLLILNIEGSALIKIRGIVKLKKKDDIIKVEPTDEGFDEQLQAFGFIPQQYGCLKYKISTQIPYMVQNQQYPLNVLKTAQSKQQIGFSEYYLTKDKIENQSE